MGDRMDGKYYNSTNWRAMKGCSNCNGYEADNCLVGGINQCKNGKDNTNWRFYDCDAWAPDFEQELIDRNLHLESQLAERDVLIERLVEAGENKGWGWDKKQRVRNALVAKYRAAVSRTESVGKESVE